MTEGLRITPSNPVRKLGRMDYERCAALHNEIYCLSWRGYSQGSYITWWEYYSPSPEIAETLDPSLIESALLFWIFEELYPDRFVWLYCATGYLMGDERGILYNQEESLAAFVGYKFEERSMCIHGWGFKSLEVILDSYLDMIDEDKVTLIDSDSPNWPRPIKPWVLYSYTKVDVEKVFLLILINLPPNMFAHNFLMSLSTQKIPFRYIAPGI
ncbi:hypothetical protein BDV41DRAFT_563758 [Aspergillus transmontanensis]|uniref:Uncharacterized protein n=1 Tax=Aspergillus transmontanensis TaxID=1034304 RepID=A0A5N6W0J5_9EURO|nr:hypothetical protein BDV41DRAFT_563758 [Aspergillus transmontanensis]